MRASVSPVRNQELSWAIIIIAQYYGTNMSWTNSRGETLHFDDVVRHDRAISRSLNGRTVFDDARQSPRKVPRQPDRFDR
jgi:hypothetical protein